MSTADHLFPTPKQVEFSDGWWQALPTGTALPRLPAEWLARASGLTIEEGGAVRLPETVPADLRVDAYHLTVSETGIRVVAEAREGVLRACATLRQLVRPDGCVPCGELTDWPDFRFRCASDWLLNCEINRWAYDWGDGPEAYLTRIKRKLDFCFDHKINQVWFSGLGWHTAPGTYAELMRECNRYARARGVRLTFAGYGGGYGTSYQKSELYRCGYQGRVFHNRRPWPEGPEYDCIGCDVPESRSLGTCATNEGLQAAKIANLRQFVETIEPGFMYIHDIDTGGFAASHHGWLWRCDECRERWPSDEMTSPQGQAGAYAAWFRKLAEGLRSVRTEGYDASRDLGLILTSPVYTTHDEPGQPEVWEQEVEYFRLLSELIGPAPEVMFGLREQFYRADGSRKIEQLRRALDEVGNGHGIHVIAFAGGDNYTSDDLCNVSAALTHFYRGAESVCLSNGGLHEEPVQVLNAEYLWNCEAAGPSPDPGSDEALAPLLQDLRLGHWRPMEIFGEGEALQLVCRHLWGKAVGDLLYRARLCGGDSGRGPVSHVWWTITREARRLTAEYIPWNDQVEFAELAERWAARTETTREALAYARQATQLTPDEDVHWFARSLEVGLGFA
ncbi:MAG: glycoside hydrolase family 20 zincin-like fold domain-containing protein, partial [Armatimonadota bacterium]